MALIELRNVHKYYHLGDTIVKANQGINLKVRKGEFVTIFGPSGCGKSTLMHMIGLLDKPTKGEVFIEGKATSGLSEDEKTKLRNERIGFVFQFFFLSPTLNALENVQLPMIFKGVPPSKRIKRAKSLLKLVGLGDRFYHMPHQLSGGQRQRVAIARALANEPSIILADEPTGNLDSKTGDEVERLFTDLWKQGNTLIIVTHDEGLASRARRTIYLKDGKIIKDVKNEKH